MKEEEYFTNDSGQLDLLHTKDDQVESQPKEVFSDHLVEASENKKTKIEKTKAPKMILILDTETTGLDYEKDQCIEIGSILFHVETRSVLAQQSFLLPTSTNNAEKINRIPAEITRLGQSYLKAIDYFKYLVKASDVIVAHNAEFDKKWFGYGDLPAISKTWICSMEDISWPADKQLKSRPSVKDLALAYGVPVWKAHRALTDCIYLAEVFIRCSELELLLTRALEPRRLVKAEISYEDRHLAKEAGFTWNEPLPRAWSRRLSDREILNLSFPVSEINRV